MAGEPAAAVVDPVVYITDTIGGVEYQASGVLIAPNEVLTAAHVVTSQGVGTATDIEVSAGYESGSAPFGTVAGTSFDYEPVDDAGDEITEQQSQYDFAVIHLAQNVNAGTMALDENYTGAASVTGYPASSGGAQVTAVETFTKSRKYTVLQGVALGPGSSGGPVWIEGTNGPDVVGIVSSGDGSSGIFVQLTASDVSQIEAWENEQETACFAAGTQIATERGEVVVERLRVGDRVRLAGGGAAPVVWLGHRHVDRRRHRRPREVAPVRIAPHAFGPDRPLRDIWLSPDHAVFIDGVLIPIRYLVNGSTIVPEPRDEVTYWHVELPAHGVILAEGLPCESYLDNGNRSAFVDGGGLVALHPDFAPDQASEAIWESAGCAPLRVDGEIVARVAARLRRRSAKLGHPPAPGTRRRSAQRGKQRGEQWGETTADLAKLLQPAWYLATYPDVGAAGMAAAAHYAGWGRREGRLPCPEIDLVRALGLIDPLTVAITMSDVISAGGDPVGHFCRVGWQERRRPNPYFETGWVLDHHDVPAGMNPLLHYVLFGECQGLSPSRHFEPAWYRRRHGLEPTVSALAHYLRHRRSQRCSPLSEFDLAAYLNEHAVLPNRDPYAHFLANPHVRQAGRVAA